MDMQLMGGNMIMPKHSCKGLKLTVFSVILFRKTSTSVKNYIYLFIQIHQRFNKFDLLIWYFNQIWQICTSPAVVLPKCYLAPVMFFFSFLFFPATRHRLAGWYLKHFSFQARVHITGWSVWTWTQNNGKAHRQECTSWLSRISTDPCFPHKWRGACGIWTQGKSAVSKTREGRKVPNTSKFTTSELWRSSKAVSKAPS